MAWSNFSYENQHKFVNAIAERKFFNSSRPGTSGSFHGYRTRYFCQTCKTYTDTYFVHTFATVLYQECLQCKQSYMNVSTAVHTVSSKRHTVLLARGIGDITHVTPEVMGRGERYLM